MYQELYNSQLERFKVSFLTAAARGGRIDEVASLIDLAAGGEDSLEILIKPLQEAIRGQHSEVVSLLFANGADPRCRDDEGNNSLHLVAKVRTRYAVFTYCCGVMIQISLAQTIAFVSILEDW
jgi:hypothetical protein